MSKIMRGRDVIRGNMAKCYITIGNETHLFMQAQEVTCEIEYDQKEVNALGSTMKQFKNAMGTGSGSGTFTFNTSIFHKMAVKFKNDFINTYWTLEMHINDPDTPAGTLKFIARDCLCKKNLLAKLVSNADILEADLEFTFGDFDIPEDGYFTPLAGSIIGGGVPSGGFDGYF